MDATSPPEPSASQRASGSSFYTAMRILPRAQREAMFEIYASAARVDDIADSNGAAAAAAGRAWRVARRDQRALRRPGRTEGRRPGAAGARVRSVARGFPDRHRRHGDGRARRHPRAELRDARSLLRSRGERGRTALGACVRPRARTPASCSRIISAGRCSSPTSCAISTRTPASDGSICRARRCSRPASTTTDPATALRSPTLAQACAEAGRTGAHAFRRSRQDHAALPAPRGARAAHHGRGLSLHPRPSGRARLRCAATAGPRLARAARSGSCCDTRWFDAADHPHHRRRPRRPRRRGRFDRARRNRRRARGDHVSPAGAAAPITTPRSA